MIEEELNQLTRLSLDQEQLGRITAQMGKLTEQIVQFNMASLNAVESIEDVLALWEG